MKTNQFLLTAAISLGLAIAANAASIGVNVGPQGQEIGAGTAGVVPQANWNDLTGGSIGATALTDDSGTLLATTAAVQSQWVNTSGAGNSTADHTLMNGGLDHGGGANLRSQIEGIPYDLYDVYIYFDGGYSGTTPRFGTYTATPSGTGASASQSAVGYDDGTFSGTFIEEDQAPGNDGGNYLLFEDMSGENLEIFSDGQNSPVPRAPWNGYQIVEVLEVIPEPSSAMLVILGAFGLVARRRR